MHFDLQITKSVLSGFLCVLLNYLKDNTLYKLDNDLNAAFIYKKPSPCIIS